MQQFIPYINEWWDEFGIMKPLHSMNKLRVPLVRDGLIEANRGSKSLESFSILDIGCGGKSYRIIFTLIE